MKAGSSLTLEEMWLCMKKHQEIARERGYGRQWAKMCKVRTHDSVEELRDAMWEIVNKQTKDIQERVKRFEVFEPAAEAAEHAVAAEEFMAFAIEDLFEANKKLSYETTTGEQT
jgi:hypothetical protein